MYILIGMFLPVPILLARHAYSLKHLVVTGFLQKLKILFFLPVRSSETAGRYISYRLVV